MKRTRIRALCAWTALLAFASPLLAQTRWMAPGKDRGFLQWVVMLGILVLISIPAFMNPKRSHMD